MKESKTYPARARESFVIFQLSTKLGTGHISFIGNKFSRPYLNEIGKCIDCAISALEAGELDTLNFVGNSFFWLWMLSVVFL